MENGRRLLSSFNEKSGVIPTKGILKDNNDPPKTSWTCRCKGHWDSGVRDRNPSDVQRPVCRRSGAPRSTVNQVPGTLRSGPGCPELISTESSATDLGRSIEVSGRHIRRPQRHADVAQSNRILVRHTPTPTTRDTTGPRVSRRPFEGAVHDTQASRPSLQQHSW